MRIHAINSFALIASVAAVLSSTAKGEFTGDETYDNGGQPDVKAPPSDGAAKDEATSPYIVDVNEKATWEFLSETVEPPSNGPFKMEYTSGQAKAYADGLRNELIGIAGKVGIAFEDITNMYLYGRVGFSAHMTDSQAEKLKGIHGVAAVMKDELRQKQTDSSLDFIGIGGTTDDGESCRRIDYDGRGVVIGVIDTGIWPEHPSFADDGTFPPRPYDLPFWDTRGEPSSPCHFGIKDHNKDDGNFTCNNKLIGARTFLNSYRRYRGQDPDEYASCRDDDGHGTHTASTAGGNANVTAYLDSLVTKVSGIAPRAQIIAYKGLGKQGGFTSDLAAAIDQAIADGVDVINYSIGGGAGRLSYDEISFLHAAKAGIFVATSAGNSGPRPNTVGGPANVPWVTSVGASTESQAFQAAVTCGNGYQAVGASAYDHPPSSSNTIDASRNLAANGLTGRALRKTEEPSTKKVKDATQKKEASEKQSILSIPMEENASTKKQKSFGLRKPGEEVEGVASSSQGDSNEVENGTTEDNSQNPTSTCHAPSTDGTSQDPENIEMFVTAPLIDAEFAGGELCRLNSLNESIVNGTIVLCRRGAVARVEKSKEVKRAGGVGMIMYETSEVGTTLADHHYVQTVHVGAAVGIEIKNYIKEAGENATASLSTDFIGSKKAPLMAGFTSRGPNSVNDIIKPDITAPGVNILAGHTPKPCCDNPEGRLFQSISGTSMSGPHIAGILALIKQAHPDWSAGEAKSAIMTTAYQDVYLGDGTTKADPFVMGSGHFDNNNKWEDPGAVYPVDYVDYNGYLCGQYPEYYDEGCEEWFPSDYNVPVEPWNLNLASFSAADFLGERTLYRTLRSVSDKDVNYTAHWDAPEGYDIDVVPSKLSIPAGGEMKFSLVITVNPRNSNFADFKFGSLTWMDTEGDYSVYSPIAAKAVASSAPSIVSYTNSMDGNETYSITAGFAGSLSVIPYGLEPATVFSDGVTNKLDVLHVVEVVGGTMHLRVKLPGDDIDPNADLDLYVEDPTGKPAGSSLSSSSDELVTIDDPMEGNWTIRVHGWYVPAGSEAAYDLCAWAIPSSNPDSSLIVSEAPETVNIRSTESIGISWSGLALDKWYWGFVHYESGSFDIPTVTVVEVDNR